MKALDWEKAARQRREAKRGQEFLHESGLGLSRREQDKQRMDLLAARLAAWANEPSVEALVERNATARADKDKWLREVLDACED